MRIYQPVAQVRDFARESLACATGWRGKLSFTDRLMTCEGHSVGNIDGSQFNPAKVIGGNAATRYSSANLDHRKDS